MIRPVPADGVRESCAASRTAVAWSSVSDRDGRLLPPSGAVIRDATLRPTRSPACACWMARSMIWWTSRTDRVDSDPDSSAKAPMRLASRKLKVSPLSCLQMSVWVVIQKPDRISQSGLGTCQRLPRLYVGIADERTQQLHARIRSF